MVGVCGSFERGKVAVLPLSGLDPFAQRKDFPRMLS